MAMTFGDTTLADEVGEVIDSILQRPATSEQDGNVTRAQTPEWDSLRHVELVLALEEQFAVRFTADEVSGLTSTIAIAETVDAKRSGRN